MGGTPLPTASALNKLEVFSSAAPPQRAVILRRMAGPLTSSHDLPCSALFTHGQQEDTTGAEFTHCFHSYIFLISSVFSKAQEWLEMQMAPGSFSPGCLEVSTS